MPQNTPPDRAKYGPFEMQRDLIVARKLVMDLESVVAEVICRAYEAGEAEGGNVSDRLHTALMDTTRVVARIKRDEMSKLPINLPECTPNPPWIEYNGKCVRDPNCPE
jgi:hypothetical protein